MTLLPIRRMLERVEIARDDSDTALFYELMYLGETITKLTVAGLVGGILDDRERHRYRQLHRLVRADGIGEWSDVLDAVLTGPASSQLTPEARREQGELMQRLAAGSWQHDAAVGLFDCLRLIVPDSEPPATKIAGRQWFKIFAQFRNATRGHGAIKPAQCGTVCSFLEASIRLVVDNFLLFDRQWAYLHRNLSGKYRVTALSEGTSQFEPLKSTTSEHFSDGVYVFLDSLHLVDLVYSDPEASDFLFPNGGFNNRRFEALSYTTDDRQRIDASPYMAPSGALPQSETQGLGSLEIQGNVFGNIPPTADDYVRRGDLEGELFSAISDDRHLIVTLIGRGGIGKTWLAIRVLESVIWTDRFEVVAWFSARDLDLLQEGAKPVQPHLVTESDVAREFVALMEPSDRSDKAFRPSDYLAKAMESGENGPILFVFDNFETMRHPPDVFSWIDAHVRSPNKVLITTRHREFKGDYPVEVRGMDKDELRELVLVTAGLLGIKGLITDDYFEELYRESDGHPYVTKILLGEVARAGRRLKVKRVAASKDQILNALFDRTFDTLSQSARRVFLTLSNWRSAVPDLALEAVLLRPENEKFDVQAAVEELRLSSLVELVASEEDDELFIVVPLAAQLFGKRKLEVSPMKSAVQADSELLQAFGAASAAHVKKGVRPQVERVFENIASRVGGRTQQLDEYLPILEVMARRYPPAWLLLARLYEESGDATNIMQAVSAVTHYLESCTSKADRELGWRKLAVLNSQAGDWSGEVHAWVELAELGGISFEDLSSAANRVNAILSQHPDELRSEERRILCRRVAAVLETRISEGDATDYSRLAWLYLRLGSKRTAMEYAKQGLVIDSQNDHCHRIVARMTD